MTTAILTMESGSAVHLPEEPDTSAQINIVPMIDVIFVVLTFFILSSLFLTRSEGLPVNLPSAVTSENPLQQHTLTLTITSGGNLQLGNEAATLDSLAEQIQARRIGDRPILLILRADEAVAHGQVVQVMDRLRTVPNVELAIATTAEG
ncbi:MAG: biopolymer transporter ExbD [Cyanobacteria bacterium P01_D01_bin.6]